MMDVQRLQEKASNLYLRRGKKSANIYLCFLIMNHCFYVGQVIMDKNPGITCVVNKTNMIDSTYRNFKMEVLAGEENMVAKVS